MTEDEIINILSDEIVSLNVGHEKYEQAVKGLLDLYQKEKEKNKELDKKFKYAVPDEIVAENYIHKDKIREKINKEIDSLINNSTNFNIGDIELLREKLLEENNEKQM